MKLKGKILVVDFNGTSPTYTHYLAMSLLKKGCNVKILGFENKNDLRIHKETVQYIGVNTKLKGLNYILNWIYLLIIARKIDVIHIQWLPMLKFFDLELILLKYLKVKNQNIFYTVHNLYPHNNINTKIVNRYNKLYKILNNLVVHVDETREKLLNIVVGKRIILIEHGLFYSNFENKKTEEIPSLVMLGMISKYKGIEDAIDSLRILKNRNIHFRLIIKGAGDRDYIQFLLDKISALDLKEEIVIEEGYIDVKLLIDLYNLASVTLMPYKNIEQSGVAFTSLGLKVPIVAYKIGGLKKIIRDFETGRLVEKNNIEKFADAIIWVLENEVTLRKNLLQSRQVNSWNYSSDILLENYFKDEF